MTIRSINPKNGEIIQEYSEFNDLQIERALALAQDVFTRHKADPIKERAQKMIRAGEILLAEHDYFATLISQEMGKTFISARAEVDKCAALCRYYAENAENFLGDKQVKSDFSNSYVKYLPLGIVLAVMPWNFPFWQVFRFAVPALMAGNVGLLKHASNVPGCALAIEEIFGRAGFESGAFQTLLIGSDKVGDVIADPRVKAVSLTGSEQAGASVAAKAGQHMKKCVLELGGSDPFIVMPSADFDKAVEMAVRGRVQNNGQTCIAAKRYIVHADIYDRFKDALIEKYEALHVGDPLDAESDIGPLATATIRADLDAQVKQSLEMGAVCLTGAFCMEGDGNYYHPGLLENIPPNSPAYKDELFGPVGLLFKVSSMQEAIDLANDTRFGLGSAVFTQDEHEISEAAFGIEAGCTFINALVASDPRLPFGGVKYSGFGRELSQEGIHEFCNIKTICIA